MSALTIAMLSHMASPEAPTGAERSLSLLATGLASRGHRVSIVAPGPWSLTGALREGGVRVETIPLRSCWLAYHEPLAPGLAALKWLRWRLPDPGRGRLHAWLERLGPDVVHVNCLPQLSGARVAESGGWPVVWHVREILPEGSRARWWRVRLGRHATRVVAVSEATAAWLRRGELADAVDVVHNGIEPGREVPESGVARRTLGLPAVPGDCVVGLVGQVLPHKGVLEFVRAAHRATREASRLRFLIAGDGPEGFVARVEREAASGPAAGRVHLVGPQPSGSLPMAACDVVCLATRTPDPLPRSVLEAMQAGRAIAAFRSGGTPELIEQETSGLLVDVGDVESLAAALVRLAREPDLRERLAAAAQRRVRESFSLERHVDRMESVLREAAA